VNVARVCACACMHTQLALMCGGMYGWCRWQATVSSTANVLMHKHSRKSTSAGVFNVSPVALVFIRARTHTHTHTHTHRRTDTHTHIHAHAHTWHTYPLTRMFVSVYQRMLSRMCIIRKIYIHACMHTCHTYTYMHACIHAIHIHTCMHAYMPYIYIHACMHTCHIYMHAYSEGQKVHSTLR